MGNGFKDGLSRFSKRGGILLRRHYIWLILLLALGIRLCYLEKSIDIDEAHSLEWAQPEALRPAYKKYTAGIFDAYQTNLIIYKFCNVLIHTGSLAIVRMPFVLLGVGGVAIAWRLGRALRSGLLAFWLAFLFAIWPIRVYSDGMIRHYGIMVFFWLAMVLCWERQRLKPSWKTFFTGMLMTLLTAWTHVVAVIIVMTPFFYIMWELLTGLRRARSGLDKSFFRSQAVRLLKTACIQLFTAGVIALMAVAVNMGPGAVSKQLGKIMPAAKKPAVTAMRPAMADNEINFPPLGYYFKIAKINATVNKLGYTPFAYMDPSARASWYLAKFVCGMADMDNRYYNSLYRICLIFLFIGAIYFAIKSPPLFLSMWAFFLLLSLLLIANIKKHMYGIDFRYYIISTSWLLLQIGAGIAIIIGSINKVRFIAVKNRGRAVVMISCIAAAMLLFLLWKPIMDSRKFEMQGWKQAYEWARPDSAQGEIMIGGNALGFRLFHDIAAAHDRLMGRGKAMTSHARDLFVSDAGNKGLAFGEMANPYQYVTCYSFIKSIPQEFFPTPLGKIFESFPHELKVFDGTNKQPSNRLFMMRYETGRHLLLTRGRLCAPLLAKFSTLPGQMNNYEIELNVETPGEYELGIYDEQPRLKEIKLDGRTVNFIGNKMSEGQCPAPDPAFSAFFTETENDRKRLVWSQTCALPLFFPLFEPARLQLQFNSAINAPALLSFKFIPPPMLKYDDKLNVSGMLIQERREMKFSIYVQCRDKIYSDMNFKITFLNLATGEKRNLALKISPQGRILNANNYLFAEPLAVPFSIKEVSAAGIQAFVGPRNVHLGIIRRQWPTQPPIFEPAR